MSDEVETMHGYCPSDASMWICGDPGPEIINLPKGEKPVLNPKGLYDIKVEIQEPIKLIRNKACQTK